ncbi:MAG: SMEK domain-containing protein [Sediminibacterium sp.]|nr:SMEK domain-containing protein [Sediminibacterium sp.]
MASTYFDNLHRILSLYYDLIERANSLSLQNEAVTAENFFCAFLNKGFGWNLVNANEEALNQSGFDLVDYEKGIAVQVTSNKQYAAKRKKTIQAFENNRDKRIKKVVILYTAKKCPDKVLERENIYGISIDGWDLPKLLKKVFYTNKLPNEQKELNRMAESMILPDIFNGSFPMTGASIVEGQLKAQVLVIKKNGIYIDRKELVEALFAYSQVNHGLLIGGPGYGKSAVLSELQAMYFKKNIPCYLIKINELIEGTDAEINAELGIQTLWVTALQKLDWGGRQEKGILIFDAFDTAKEEALKQRVLKHIRKAREKLGDRWHVIASVRTFEASHSSQLRELFAQSRPGGKPQTRIFSIPALSDAELGAALKQDMKLKRIASANSVELRKLLAIPYFLKLFEQVAESIGGLKSKTQISIESEDQLLEIYWNNVVEQTGEELFLHKLTQELVASVSLSCAKLKIVNENNTAYYERLVSAGVITESSASRLNISFSHNILLEFAVAKFIIPHGAEAVVQYLSENEKVAFLFRQSFIYYYSRVWKTDQRLFWKHYHAIRNGETALYRLVHQTILNYVLCVYYHKVDELNEVLEHADELTRGATLRKILEAIRFISKGIPREKDTALLRKAAARMHILCVWEMGFLMNQAIKYFQAKQDTKAVAILAKASVEYMQFVLVERKVEANKFNAERNGGPWAIQNIMLCFAHQPRAAKRLLTGVLDVLQEPGFPIYWFYSFAEGLKQLAAHDPAFVIKLYENVYQHNEKSSEETLLGSGVVMALRSNRSQDFCSVHHQLEVVFEMLLDKHPDDFLPLGLHLLNTVSKRPLYYTTLDKAMPMLIGKVKSKIIPDFSFFDNDTDRQYGPASHLEKIILYLQKLIEGGKPLQALQMMRIALVHAEVSLAWKRLLVLLAEHAALFKTVALEVLLNHSIYICSETLHEAGELIKALWSLLSVTQQRKLEKTILSLLDTVHAKKDFDFVHHRVIRLLSCIGASQLHYVDAKKILEEYGVKENKPVLEKPRLMPYTATEEEQMKRKGVSTEDETEVKLYSDLKRIEDFCQLNGNEKIKQEKDSHLELEPVASHLYDAARDPSCNEKFRMHIDNAVSSFYAIVARKGAKLGVKLRRKILDIARFYLSSKVYIPEAYEFGENGTHILAYSSNPRIEATDALGSLMHAGETDGIAEKLLDLMSDPSLAVRYRSMRHLHALWKIRREQLWARVIVSSMLEQDGFLLQILIQYLTWDDIVKDNQKNVESCLLLLEGRFQTMEKVGHELWGGYIQLLMRMVIRKKNETAKAITHRNLQYADFAKYTVFQIVNKIDPHSELNQYARDPTLNEYFFSMWMEILQLRFATIQAKGLESNELQDEFEIIDLTIQQLYYTTLSGKNANRNKAIEKNNLRAYYQRIKPMLHYIVEESEKLGGGFMVAHTGYYFIQLLDLFFELDTAFVLQLASRIVRCAAASSFTYDQTTLREIVKLTERLLADHKDLLSDPVNFNSLLQILDLFANSGWQEALELTWRLKEIF